MSARYLGHEMLTARLLGPRPSSMSRQVTKTRRASPSDRQPAAGPGSTSTLTARPRRWGTSAPETGSRSSATRTRSTRRTTASCRLLRPSSSRCSNEEPLDGGVAMKTLRFVAMTLLGAGLLLLPRAASRSARSLLAVRSRPSRAAAFRVTTMGSEPTPGSSGRSALRWTPPEMSGSPTTTAAAISASST